MSHNKYLIKCLCVLSKQQRNQLLKIVDKSCIDCIRDCCKSILEGGVKITPTQKKKLRRYKTKLRAVADPQKGSQEARKHLQYGGFFQALLPVLASIVSPLISILASK